MKKTKYIILFLLICSPCFGSVNLDKIAQIESSNNPNAYNPVSEAVGAFQFTAIAVRDFNRENGTKIKLEAMYDESKAAHLAIWYFEVRLPELIKSAGYKDTLNNRLIGYNCGVACLGKPLPRETINYIKKYHKNKLKINKMGVDTH